MASDQQLLFESTLPAAASAAAQPSLTDPSTADASVVVFEREVPLEVRHSDDHDSNLGTLLSITVKLLVLYHDDGVTPESVRIELSRENDLFFHMYHSLQEKGFLAMAARQKLMVEYSDYPRMIISNFSKCVKDPHNTMAVLYIHRDGSGRMDLIQNIDGFKFVELLSIDFLLTPSDVIKQHIIYRYFSMKSQVEQLQARLQDVNEVVKSKSPSLLLAIKKTPLRTAQQAAAAAASSSSSSSFSSSSASALQHQHPNRSPQSHSSSGGGGAGGLGNSRRLR